MRVAMSPQVQILIPTVAFLTPLFLVGLGAIAIPVLMHLIQRERKRVIEFPSLMFVRRIPYQSVRRRRIRHWLLLLLRAAAIALDRRGVRAAVLPAAAPVAAAVDRRRARGRHPARSVGEHGLRRSLAAGAQDGGARRSSAAWAPTTARRSCCSRATPKRTCAPPRTATRLEAAIDAAKVGSGATRYGPALKLAESILSRSPMKRREAVLISDFQKQRLERLGGSALPRGDDAHARVGRVAGHRRTSSVPSVTFARASFSGQERITVTAGLSNKGDAAAQGRAGHADDRRPRDRDRARHRRAARVGVGLLHAVHAGRRQRARHR